MNAGPSWSMTELQKRSSRRLGAFGRCAPLQEQAMRAVMDGARHRSSCCRPAAASLCVTRKAPAVCRGGTTDRGRFRRSFRLKMKDQVDRLQTCGDAGDSGSISSQNFDGIRSAHETDVGQGAMRLLFVSPERLVLDSFPSVASRRKSDVRTVRDR